MMSFWEVGEVSEKSGLGYCWMFKIFVSELQGFLCPNSFFLPLGPFSFEGVLRIRLLGEIFFLQESGHLF